MGREERSELQRSTRAIYSLPALEGCPAGLAGLTAQKGDEVWPTLVVSSCCFSCSFLSGHPLSPRPPVLQDQFQQLHASGALGQGSRPLRTEVWPCLSPLWAWASGQGQVGGQTRFLAGQALEPALPMKSLVTSQRSLIISSLSSNPH